MNLVPEEYLFRSPLNKIIMIINVNSFLLVVSDNPESCILKHPLKKNFDLRPWTLVDGFRELRTQYDSVLPSPPESLWTNGVREQISPLSFDYAPWGFTMDLCDPIQGLYRSDRGIPPEPTQVKSSKCKTRIGQPVV